MLLRNTRLRIGFVQDYYINHNLYDIYDEDNLYKPDAPSSRNTLQWYISTENCLAYAVIKKRYIYVYDLLSKRDLLEIDLHEIYDKILKEQHTLYHHKNLDVARFIDMIQNLLLLVEVKCGFVIEGLCIYTSL